MKKTTILGLTLAIAGSVIFASCKDDFTEEDALNAQQTVDLNIVAYDPNSGSTIPNATVLVFHDGKKDSIVTNSNGIAFFPSVKIGSSIPVTVKADGYTTAKFLADATTSDYRQSQHTITLSLYALTGSSTATIRGKAEIETDLTNTVKEKVPAGTVITAFINPNSNLNGTSNEIILTTTVDANGNYSLTVPTSLSGMPITLTYPDLELDQKIAINRLEEEPVFPKTAPSIQTIKTVFTTSGSAMDIPSVYPIFAIVSGGTSPAGVNLGFITAENKILMSNYGVDAENRGSGFTPTAKIPAVVTSLLGQTTAAVAVGNSNADGEIESIDITDGGAGYIKVSNVNSVEKNPSFPSTMLELKSGDIKVFNIYYGTGTSRAKDVK